MNKLTYREAYDKIIDAYFKDQIRPCDSNFCFCGTLSPTRGLWNAYERFSWGKKLPEIESHKYDHDQPYSLSEYKRMEWALINNKNKVIADEDYEAALFAGMSAALDILKQIHIERGENVDELPALTKRNLQPA